MLVSIAWRCLSILCAEMVKHEIESKQIRGADTHGFELCCCARGGAAKQFKVTHLHSLKAQRCQWCQIEHGGATQGAAGRCCIEGRGGKGARAGGDGLVPIARLFPNGREQRCGITRYKISLSMPPSRPSNQSSPRRFEIALATPTRDLGSVRSPRWHGGFGMAVGG